MLWQKRVEPGQNRAGAPVDLRSMTGLTGRLLYAEGITGSRMTSLSCTVRKVDHTEIIVDVGPLDTGLPQPESAVILEVANRTALVQCFTTVRARSKGPELSLRTPARPHIQQRRRFPRVEVFLGITLHTPDRPIDPLPAQLTNISLDGAACVLTEPINPGSRLCLNLSSLGLTPPNVNATVVRCTPSPSHLWVMGLQFHGLLAEQETHLGKYISDIVDTRHEQDEGAR